MIFFKSDQASLNETAELSVGFDQLIACSSICNNACFDQKDACTPITNRKADGDATDIALLKFSTQHAKHARLSELYQVLSDIPFNSKNKWMMKIVMAAQNNGVHASLFPHDSSTLMLLKGAPDYLLQKCSKILLPSGEERDLSSNDLSDLIKLQNDWCVLGQRVLLICKKSLDSSSHTDLSTKLE